MQILKIMSSILRLISRRIAPSCRRLLSPPAKSFSTASAAHRELLRRPSSPWLMLPPSFLAGGGNMVYNFYSPINGKVVSFNNKGGREETELMSDHLTTWMGSSHGWLALFNSGSRRVFLSNPISGRRIELPPLAGEPITAEADMRCPQKVIISSSPEEKDCRAVAVLGSANRVAFCNPSRGDEEWTPLGTWNEDPIGIHNISKYRFHRDFVYSASRQRFFGFSVSACCREEELEEYWDFTSPVGPKMVRQNRLGRDDRESDPNYLCNTYLVHGKTSDQLYIVRSYFLPEGTIDFDVYKTGDGGGLKTCSSLDGLAMFVGINHSFAVKASEYRGLKPDCIYFSDAKMSCNDGQFIGTFDYETKTCSPLYYDSLKQQDLTPQPWFTPTLN